MKLSVVIATYNRADVLKKCLLRLHAQKGVDFEVIVVDDDSPDNTEAVVREFEGVTYIKQPKSHQGVARNRGVAVANGDVVVFINDDIFVREGFLSWHKVRHEQNADENVVVLGKTQWDPDLEVNDYMRFLDDSGWQFGYKFLTAGFVNREDAYKFFYTSNISMKRSFFEKEKFNEAFKVYGWEDIELGYRLHMNHGMNLFYEPMAMAYHHHQMNEKDLPTRMNKVGASAVHFEKIQPTVKIIPRGVKKTLIKVAANDVMVRFSKILGKKTYFKLQSWNEFMKGVKN